MKISLIYARIGHSTQPPMGILLMAAVLEKIGHEVKVEDPFESYEFLDRVVKFQPDLIGISFVSPALLRAKGIIEYLRKKLPDSIYCCGGPHATAFPKDTLQFLDVDFVIVGEGEYILRDICERLERNEDYRGLSGLVYKQNGRVVRTPDLPLIQNLDELPLPARHLLEFDRYLAPPGQIRGIALGRCTTMHTRRGCPGRCSFCGSHIVHRIVNGKTVRMRSVANVMEEIYHLKDSYGIKGIWFTDDVITNDKEWMHKFCNILRKEKLNLIWGAHARIIDITGYGGYEMLKQMKESGCVQLDIGVESGSPRILNLLRKGTSPKMIKEAFDITNSVGIRTLATFMVGNPTETYEDIDMTMQLAKKIKPNFTLVTFLTPTPGTDMYTMTVKNNWFDPSVYYNEGYSWAVNEEPLVVTVIPKEELKNIRAKLENQFAIRNYINFVKGNPRFLIQLLFMCMKYPRDFVKGIDRFLKTKKISIFADSLIRTYRFRILRPKKIKGKISRNNFEHSAKILCSKS